MRNTVPTSRRALRGAAVPFLLGAALLALPGQAGAASGETVTRTFETLGCGGSGGVSANELSIPAGVTSVQVSAIGGAGDGDLPRAGKGAIVRGTLAVDPGDTLYVCVDQGGGAGGNAIGGVGVNSAGGAGGGYSSVSSLADASALPFLLAAGGGGAAAASLTSSPGFEGGGGDAGTLTADGVGGYGGLGPAQYGHGGDGATEAEGAGSGGTNSHTSGGAATAGDRLIGGTGGNAVVDASNMGGSGGGGGGAGVYGGGGGGGGWGPSADATRANGGGGGGGTSRCAAPASSCTSSLASLAPDASVTITWAKPAATVTASVVPDPVRAGAWIQYTANFAQTLHDGTVAFSVDGVPVEGCEARGMATEGGYAYCVTEAPARAGSYTLEVEYSGGAGYTATSDDVGFTVQTAVASLSTNSLDFGALLVGKTGGQQTVTLRNGGDATLTIGSASPPPPFAPVRDGGSPRACLEPCGPTTPGVLLEGPNASDFAIVADGCDDTSLAAGESCDVTIAFAPGAEGARSAVLVFATDAENPRAEVALRGTGTAPAPPEERREPETRQPETRRPDPVTPPAGDPSPPAPQEPKPQPTAPRGDGAVLAPSAGGRAKVSRTGSVTLPLVCPAGEVCRVSGTLTFSASAFASRSSAAASASKTQVLARFKGITVRGDSVRSLRLRLPAAFVRAAQRAGKRSVRATLTVRTRLGSGRTITKRQQVTLLIPRAAPRAQAPQPGRRPSFTG